MNARDLFLEQHGAVHSAAVGGNKMSMAERTFAGLTDEQMRVRPREDLNSLAWLMWHMARTEDIILKYNPTWPMAGNQGIHIRPLEDLPAAGFEPMEQVSWEVRQPFTHEGWRGRMRTCNGVGASLPPEKVAAFDRELAELLRERWPQEPLQIEHRVWIVVARRP